MASCHVVDFNWALEMKRYSCSERKEILVAIVREKTWMRLAPSGPI